MIHNGPSTPTSRRAGRRLAIGLAIGFSAAGAGCDVLEVDPNPQAVPGDQIDRPNLLQARLVGAEADFFLAYDMAIVFGGLFTDELIDGTGLDEIDQRRVTEDNGLIGAADEAPEGIDGLWTPMQRAVFVANALQDDLAADNFPGQVPNPASSPELARMSLFAGYARLMLGDLFCTTAFDGTGPELTSEETWELAADEFTMAIDAANAPDEVRFAALVGRARARLQLGDEAGAVADAAQVPLDFEFIADVFATNSQREENDLWNMLTDSQRFSVDPVFRGLTIDDSDEPDPRVDVFQDPADQFASDGSTELFQVAKYRTATSPIRLASGAEARLIMAEVEGGQTAVDLINDVRGLYEIDEWEPVTGDAAEIRDKVIEERARTLFLEGQRMGDLRRYISKFGIDLFQTGPNFGDQTCFPLPDAERDNNPGI